MSTVEKMFDLKIDDVQDIMPPFVQNREIDGRLPKPPFVMLLNMKVASGKTITISNFLLKSTMYGYDEKGNHCFDQIYIFSPTLKNDRGGCT